MLSVRLFFLARGNLRKLTLRPAFRAKPVLPPTIVLFECGAPASGESGPACRDGLKRAKADTGAEFVDMGGVRQSPRTVATVARISEPLRAETLGTVLVKSDAVFEVSGVPLRNAILCRTGFKKLQDVVLKVWFTNGMLGNQPSGLGSVLTSESFGGPAVLGDEFAKASGVLDVDGFHLRDIVTAQPVCVLKFLADLTIFRTHGQEFEAEGIDQHRFASGYGAWEAGTPRSAMLSPFFSDGTALTWRTIAETGARGSAMTLPT